MAQVQPDSAAGGAEGLLWLKDELNASLERVRGFIEDYLEASANPLPLQRALVELHQVRGSLRMIQCDGAALFAEEMRGAIGDLLKNLDAASEKAFEALLGATVQLADYLDLLTIGEADNALVFLPLINELRVARTAPVLSEAALFARYAASKAPLALAGGPLPGRAAGAGQNLARQRLPVYQAALLHVLQGREPEANLARLETLCAAMAEAVADNRGRHLFTAAAALAEVLREGGVAADLEIKRLLGRVGQQLKAAADAGDAALAQCPLELIYGPVYFVGRATSRGAKARALRQAYNLDALLPQPSELEQLRGRLRGPNTALVARLAAAIRQDLDTVKDSIDLVLRAGARAPVALAESVTVTRRIGDTLAMLGLDMLHRVVDNQARVIAALDAAGERGHDAWMDVAVALLRVEQGLDNALFAHMYRGGEPAPEAAGPPHQDIGSGRAAIYREALVNLARIKILVPDFIDGGEPVLVGEAARLLREIEAGLDVLADHEGVALAVGLRAFVNSQAMLETRRRSSLVLRLADAIAGIEVYLEALQAGHGRPQALYERAAASVAKLEVPPGQEAPLVEETPAAPEAAAAPGEDLVDPEIRAVFLQEAREVLASLQCDLPVWIRSRDDHRPLAEIRRAFHTLKGSGRMVGAATIGEFAWAVENLLNRCLGGAMAVDAAVVDLVQQAVGALPGLIRDFEAGRPPRGRRAYRRRPAPGRGARHRRPPRHGTVPRVPCGCHPAGGRGGRVCARARAQGSRR